MKPGLKSHLFFLRLISSWLVLRLLGLEIETVPCWRPILWKKSKFAGSFGFGFCKAQIFVSIWCRALLPSYWELRKLCTPIQVGRPPGKKKVFILLESNSYYLESYVNSHNGNKDVDEQHIVHVYTCFSPRLQTENNVKWLVEEFEERKPRWLNFSIFTWNSNFSSWGLPEVISLETHL